MQHHQFPQQQYKVQQYNTICCISHRLDAMNPLRTGPVSDEELDEVFAQPVVTIIGFGSLLSEGSSRWSFPELKNFREITVRGYRRTFQHPAFVFFERGIADATTGCCSSLSAHPDDSTLSTFTGVAFDIAPCSKGEWLKREEEFVFHICKFEESSGGGSGLGIMCCSAESDEVYISRWGQQRYRDMLDRYNLSGIWGLALNRNIKPCSVYLRHCVLAAMQRSPECLASFLDQTFLADLATTLREYLDSNPWIMDLAPPESLASRYNG